MGEVANQFRWPAPFTGQIYEFGKSLNFQGGYAIKGSFDVLRSLYMVDPFKSLRNRNKRQVHVRKAVQTGGSVIADVYASDTMHNDPADMLWLMQDDDFAKKYCEQRFNQLIESTKCLKDLVTSIDRHAKQKTMIMLRAMTLMICGLNEGNVQSLSWPRVIIDEFWMSKVSGLGRQAKARTTAFPHTKKILIIGQAGEENDDEDIEWSTSSQCEWGLKCPCCKKLQPYHWNIQRSDGTWAGMKWETNEFTKPRGKWNYAEAGKTARIECIYCGKDIDDIPGTRRLLNDTGEYIIGNTGADATIDGYHWVSEANIDIPFSEGVQAYLKAKEQDEEYGNRTLLKEFFQKRRAIPWSENQSSEFYRVPVEAYEINTDWKEEKYRFMTVDCQRDFMEFWIIIRAWSSTGESRLLYAGSVTSWSEVSRVQSEYQVKDQRVFVDCGYETMTVYEQCLKHGHWGSIKGKRVWLCWVALKGMDHGMWSHEQILPDGSIERELKVYSPKGRGNPGLGKYATQQRCPYYLWSNLHVKDILKKHIDGKGGKFTIPEIFGGNANQKIYNEHMNSERRQKNTNTKTGAKSYIWTPIGKRPTHLKDGECMQFVVAFIVAIIGGQRDIVELEQPEPHLQAA